MNNDSLTTGCPTVLNIQCLLSGHKDATITLDRRLGTVFIITAATVRSVGCICKRPFLVIFNVLYQEYTIVH